MNDDRPLRRTDDWIVRHWEIIAFVIAIVFFGGGWWQGSIVKEALADKFQTDTTQKLADHEHRITQVEDAVVYLRELVEREQKRGGGNGG